MISLLAFSDICHFMNYFCLMVVTAVCCTLLFAFVSSLYDKLDFFSD